MMKSKITSFVLALCCAMILFTSCNNSDSYAELIPANPDAVLKINTRKVFKSVDSEISDENINQIREYMANEGLDVKLREFFEELIKDPGKSGVDLSRNIYFFYKENHSMEYALIFSMKNKKDFEDMLALFTSNDMGVTQVREYNELSYSTVDRNVIIFNDEWLCVSEPSREFERNNGESDVMLAEKLIDEILYWKKQKDNNFMSSIYFDESMNNDNDINLFVSFSNLAKSLKSRELKELSKGVDDFDFDNLALTYGLESKNGEMELSFKLLSNSEDNKKLLKENSSMFGEINKKGFKYIPADAMVVAASNFDGEKIFNKMVDCGFLKPVTDNMDPFTKLMSDALKSVKGNYIFTMDQMSDESYFTMFAESDNENMAKQFYDMYAETDGEHSKQIAPSEYSYAQEHKIYNYDTYQSEIVGYKYHTYGYKDGCLYFRKSTNENKLAEVSSSYNSSDAKGKMFYFRFNPQGLVNYLNEHKDRMSPENIYKVEHFCQNVESIELVGDDLTSASLILKLTDKDINPVKLLYQECEKWYTKFYKH